MYLFTNFNINDNINYNKKQYEQWTLMVLSLIKLVITDLFNTAYDWKVVVLQRL